MLAPVFLLCVLLVLPSRSLQAKLRLLISVNPALTFLAPALLSCVFFATATHYACLTWRLTALVLVYTLFPLSASRMLATEAGGGIVSEHLKLRSDAVSGELFKTLKTPLLRGRFFSAEDGPDSPLVPGCQQLCGVAADLALRCASKSTYLISRFEADEARLCVRFFDAVTVAPALLGNQSSTCSIWDTHQMYPARFA
jgi:hypothetical protein